MTKDRVLVPCNTGNADLYGGIALSIASLAALVIANSSLGHLYSALLEVTGEIRIGSIGISKSLGHWSMTD
jgi:NhaA family Na+:H+ antiporter